MAALWFYHFWLVARGDENIPDRRRVAVVSVWRTQRGISLVERAQECPTLFPPPLPSCVAHVTWWGEGESDLPQDDMEMAVCRALHCGILRSCRKPDIVDIKMEPQLTVESATLAFFFCCG